MFTMAGVLILVVAALLALVILMYIIGTFSHNATSLEAPTRPEYRVYGVQK